ncbi:MAG: nucleotide exchange factor GrpE [Candidatus Limimorpha sp.]
MADKKEKKNHQKDEKTAEVNDERTTEVNEEKTTEQQGTETNNGDKEKEAVEEANPLEEAHAKYNELNDKYLRLYSEYENYRRRTSSEKVELIKTAAEGTIMAMLPILDDFERALSNMDNSEDKTHFEGVQLIYNKFKRALEQKGLEEIKAAGEKFNTDEHEALTQVPAPDESKKDTVIDVIQKGYKLNGKVIRYARVVVGC